MTSLHYVTHAVALAVIATLARKYLQAQYAYEALEDSCQSHCGVEHQSCSGRHVQERAQHHKDNSDLPADYLKDFGTSMWCSGKNRTDRMCRFENLCYNSVKDDFVFVHSKRSDIEGVDLTSVHHELLELSTVAGHNIHYLRLADLPVSSLADISVSWVHEQTLLFNRFKPDNIMHVLHDDIFPLHHTLEAITFGTKKSKNTFDVKLVLMDGWDPGEFENLYTHFTTYDIVTKQDLRSMSELVCFRRGNVGISKTTTWYQYGFDRSQGRLEHSTAVGRHIHRTVEYLLNAAFKDDCETCDSEEEYLVLLSRKENRLILNEPELTVAIAAETGLRVVVISFETHRIAEMMKIVHYSRGVIGMHGSLMILSAFLRPGSVVMELFPYAVNPANYAPFKTLAVINGMNLVYKSWANEDRKSTVIHPDWPAELGGIQDLPTEEQSFIISQSEVPLHLCCEDPSWLFHIYQDTTVDISSVLKILTQSLTEVKSISHEPHVPLLPGPVKHVSCDVISNDVKLSWERPWNVQYLGHETVEYELWLQNTEDETTLSVIVGDVSSYDISKHVTSGLTYNIWVRCILNRSILGSFSEAIKFDLTYKGICFL